jgi:hypothetical protein
MSLFEKGFQMTSGFISQLLYFLIGMEGWEIFDSAKLV